MQRKVRLLIGPYCFSAPRYHGSRDMLTQMNRAAMRLALTALMACYVSAQYGAGAYGHLVDEWLRNARTFLEAINGSNDKLGSAFSNLKHKLPEDVPRSANWTSVQQKEAALQGGLDALSQIIRKDIASNEEYLRRLNRSGGIETNSVVDNLRARTEFQQALAENLGQFMGPQNQIGNGLRSLPPSITESAEFHETMLARDAMSGLLETSSKQFAARASEYAAMRSNIVSAPASVSAAPQTDFQYPTSQRIQISEPCPAVVKWLAQGIVSGPNLQMQRYEPELGTLTFKALLKDNLSKAETIKYLEPTKTKNVRADQLAFTFRSLVTSTLSFDNAPHSTGDSCAIAAAFKFVSKDGASVFSNGKMEVELLEKLKTRYAEHGLDY
jgi:hypothetical protein